MSASSLWPKALRSLGQPQLRVFFVAQSVSLLGSWVQPVAQQWLVWRMTGSHEMVAWLTFATQTPSLLLGLWAGAAADRLPKRGLMLASLGVATLQATTLAVLALLGVARPWEVVLLGVLLGLTYPFEIPSRQALLAELAGPDTPNVVALNSTVVTVMRVLGPSLGGLLAASVGEGWCFALNAASFTGVLVVVARLKVVHTPPHGPQPAVGEGLRWAWARRDVRGLFGLLFCLSLFGQAWGTLMPGYVDQTFAGGAALLGRLLAFAGGGALLAALGMLLVETGLEWRIGVGAGVMGAGILVLSFAHAWPAAALGAFLVGLGQLTQSSGILSLVQTLAPQRLRGRLLGVFTTLFVGLTPFGALAASFIAEHRGVWFAQRVLAGGMLLGAAAYLLYRRTVPAGDWRGRPAVRVEAD